MDIFNTITPDSMVEALQRRMAQLAAGEEDEVVRLHQVVTRQPRNPEGWFDYAMALNQAALQYTDMAVRLAELSQDEDAPEAVEPTSEEQPAEERQIVVDVSAAKPLYEQSLAAFAKVLELEPDYYGVQTQMGTVYGNLGRLPEAEQCYLRALEEDEEDFSAAYYLGCTYRDMGNDEQAKRYFDLARQLNPDDVAFCNCQGQSVEQ